MFDLKKWIAKVTQYIADSRAPVRFSLTRASSISGGQGRGIYDKSTNIVRINAYFNNGDTGIGTSAGIFTVPADYRPSTAKEGSGMVFTGAATSPIAAGSAFTVGTDGTIKQNMSVNTTRGFCYIEYVLD